MCRAGKSRAGSGEPAFCRVRAAGGWGLSAGREPDRDLSTLCDAARLLEAQTTCTHFCRKTSQVHCYMENDPSIFLFMLNYRTEPQISCTCREAKAQGRPGKLPSDQGQGYLSSFRFERRLLLSTAEPWCSQRGAGGPAAPGSELRPASPGAGRISAAYLMC